VKGRYVAGLDIGMTKICAAVGRVDRAGMEVVACGQVAAEGFRKGVVVDMDEAANSIRMAAREAESLSGVPVKSAYAGIAGTHVKCAESFGATGIRGKEIRQKDVDRVVEAASAMYVPLDREVVHVVPSEFVIDGQDGIGRPLGMAGVRLEVKVQVITASQAVLENIERALARSGMRAAEMVFQPLAAAMSVLKDEETQHGALLLDMGGGSTDIALYKGGTLRYVSVVPVGGLHMTNDIAVGLKLPQKEAERLKRKYGSEEAGEFTEALGMNGKPRRISAAELVQITRLRCEEIFELVKSDIQAAVIRHRPLCAVLTGGGALMRGVPEMAERWLSLPVRLGLPERVEGSLQKDVVRDPAYAAAAGLLLYGMRREGLEGGSYAGALADAFTSAMGGAVSGGWEQVKRFFTRAHGNL
jgi:cell division protein FtsA